MSPPIIREKQIDRTDGDVEYENCTRNDVGELSLSDHNRMKA